MSECKKANLISLIVIAYNISLQEKWFLDYNRNGLKIRDFKRLRNMSASKHWIAFCIMSASMCDFNTNLCQSIV